jgi:PAS domain S-box-containing protein
VEREALHTAIVGASLDCIVIMDDGGVIREWNPAAETTFGYRREEAIGQLLSDTIIPPAYREAHAKGLARYLSTGEANVLGRRIEITAIRRDGAEFPVELTITETKTKSRRLFTAYLRDITSRVKMEEELRGLNRQLEERIVQRTMELAEANQRLETALQAEQEIGMLKSSFIATVTHEFRTPLGVILSATEMLQRYFERLEPTERKEQLATIDEAVHRMAELMEEVLVFHKVEAGVSEVNASQADVAALCRRIANEVSSATGHRCQIECSGPPKLNAKLDERLLRHVLTNILNNAVKYSAAGDVVRMSLAKRGNRVVFTVVDQGIGIPAEDLPKLYSPFRRGGNVGQRAGTGLGLAIVKRCVDLHGGTIEMESTVGKGTTVTIQIPSQKDQ